MIQKNLIMQKIKKDVTVCSGIVASVLLFLMLVVATLQMLSNRLNILEGNYAYAIRCLMIWSFMLGAVYCFGKGKHIAFILLLERFKNTKVYFMLEIIIHVLILFFIIAVFLVGAILVLPTQREIALVVMVMPVFSILTSAIVCIDFVELLKNGSSEDRG